MANTIHTSNAPGELARIAALISAKGGRATRIHVKHEGSTKAPSEQIDPAQGETRLSTPPEIALESLVFAVAGCRFTASTYPSSERPTMDAQFETQRIRAERVGRAFSGVMPPNPAFTYENSDTTEVLIGFGKKWVPTFRSSMVIQEIVDVVTQAAVQCASAPILFLQSPVAAAPSEPRGDGSHEGKRFAVSNAVRVSVAIPAGNDRARIDFLTRVERACGRAGLSMHVADLRGSRVRGEWFEVRTFAPRTHDEYVEERFGGVSNAEVDRAVMVSVVGPARTGSTLAVVRHMRDSGIGVLGVAVSALSETAVINLVLPVEPNVPAGHVASSGGSDRDTVAGLRPLVRLCSLEPPQPTENIYLPRLLGYRVLRSEPVAISLSPKSVHRATTYPIWVAWELEGGQGQVDSLTSVLENALGERAHHVELAYSRSRATANGRIRGRGKLSVQVPAGKRPDSVPGFLKSLAEYAESEVISRLDLSASGERTGTVRVTSRERWIGRASLPL